LITVNSSLLPIIYQGIINFRMTFLIHLFFSSRRQEKLVMGAQQSNGSVLKSKSRGRNKKNPSKPSSEINRRDASADSVLQSKMKGNESKENLNSIVNNKESSLMEKRRDVSADSALRTSNIDDKREKGPPMQLITSNTDHMPINNNNNSNYLLERVEKEDLLSNKII
jgi:hypothetical protein